MTDGLYGLGTVDSLLITFEVSHYNLLLVLKISKRPRYTYFIMWNCHKHKRNEKETFEREIWIPAKKVSYVLFIFKKNYQYKRMST